jgi:adenine deaminase
MIPTLKMFATTVTTEPEYLNPIYDQVRQFRTLGGDLLLGTDVGHMTDYRTDGELRAPQHTGIDARGILRLLTTAPAGRFGVQNEKSRVAPGLRADLVTLNRIRTTTSMRSRKCLSQFLADASYTHEINTAAARRSPSRHVCWTNSPSADR